MRKEFLREDLNEVIVLDKTYKNDACTRKEKLRVLIEDLMIENDHERVEQQLKP